MRKSKREPVSAAELMARLHRDPKWVAARDTAERERLEEVKKNREAAAPVLNDLIAAGFEVDSVSDLFNKKLNYEAAIPVLIAWLPRVRNLAVKEDVARALSVRWAKPVAAKVLVEELKQTNGQSDSDLCWALANALAVVADDSVFGDLIAMAYGQGYGKAREMIVLALGNMVRERAAAVTALVDLLKDEAVVGFAVMALGRLKTPAVRLHLQALLKHQKGWVKKEIEKALQACAS